MKNIVIDDTVMWPISVGIVLIVFVLTASSCSEKIERIDLDETKAYLESKCEKTPIAGSQGTYWICNKTTGGQQ